MNLKTLGLALAFGALALGTFANTADARGRVYLARNPKTGAPEKYLTIFETTHPADIVELEYEPMGEGNGAEYKITATGFFSSDSFVVLHGQKQGMVNIEEDFPHAMYPMQNPDQDSIKLTSSGHFPMADKFLEGCIPDTYQYLDGGTLFPSNYAQRMLLEQADRGFTGIDRDLLDQKHQYYTYEYKFLSNIHEAYPQIHDSSFGNIVYAYYNSPQGERLFLNMFIIDGKMENIWRVDNDGTLFQVYGLDGVG